MRWFLAIPFIFLGSFLFILTIDDIGIIGQIIKILMGFGCFFVAGFIVKDKKEK
nr:hypothetical protein [uncultured Bacillus sp.]